MGVGSIVAHHGVRGRALCLVSINERTHALVVRYRYSIRYSSTRYTARCILFCVKCLRVVAPLGGRRTRERLHRRGAVFSLRRGFAKGLHSLRLGLACPRAEQQRPRGGLGLPRADASPWSWSQAGLLEGGLLAGLSARGNHNGRFSSRALCVLLLGLRLRLRHELHEGLALRQRRRGRARRRHLARHHRAARTVTRVLGQARGGHDHRGAATAEPQPGGQPPPRAAAPWLIIVGVAGLQRLSGGQAGHSKV